MKTTVNVKIKKLSPEAKIPKYSKPGDAGLDLTATSINETELYIEYGTSLAFEIPSGYVGLIYPRSSLSNYDLVLSNHVGVVDSGYRGEVKFRFKKSYTQVLKGAREAKYYNVGDKIGQLIVMPYPLVILEEVEELGESSRGATGFGSSGI